MRQVLATAAVACAAVLLVALAAPAGADAYWGFQSPSGNIACGAIASGVGCIIYKQTFAQSKEPCDGTYTAVATIKRSGRRGRITIGCYGGVPFPVGGWTLGYGRSTALHGVRCRSSRSGIRCVNPRGHGFKIRKIRVSAF